MESPEKISEIFLAAGAHFNKLAGMAMELENEEQCSTNHANDYHPLCKLCKPKRKYKKAALKRKQLADLTNVQEQGTSEMLQKVTLKTLNTAEPQIDLKGLKKAAK